MEPSTQQLYAIRGGEAQAKKQLEGLQNCVSSVLQSNISEVRVFEHDDDGSEASRVALFRNMRVFQHGNAPLSIVFVRIVHILIELSHLERKRSCWLELNMSNSTWDLRWSSRLVLILVVILLSMVTVDARFFGKRMPSYLHQAPEAHKAYHGWQAPGFCRSM